MANTPGEFLVVLLVYKYILFGKPGAADTSSVDAIYLLPGFLFSYVMRLKWLVVEYNGRPLKQPIDIASPLREKRATSKILHMCF